MSNQANIPYKAGFPFSDSITSVFELKTRKEAIQTALVLILTTPVGSLVYDPDFGSHIPALIYEVISPPVINLIYYYVKKDLEKYLPLIKLTSIRVDYEPPRKITIWVGYQDRNDPTSEQEQAPVAFSQIGGLNA